MKNSPTDLVETLRQTSRCRAEVAKTAETFVDLTRDQYENLLSGLIDAGDGKALGILLLTCGLNRIRLDPTLLAGALKVVGNLEDFSFPYIVQDLTAVDPLLHAADARDIDGEHRVFAVRLAVELTVRLGGDREALKKALRRTSIKFLPSHLRVLNDLSLNLLNLELEEMADFPWETEKDVMKDLPEDKPPVVIGGNFTVRRPVPKIGRNAPCHCGSGKKYKKCCYDSDRELLRDASPYEGITMSQVRSAPELVDGEEMIRKMKAFELKKLTPSKLNDDQLIAAHEQAHRFRLNEVAFAMLLELKERPLEDEELVAYNLRQLLDTVLHGNDAELARRIIRHIPADMLPDDDDMLFHLKLLKNREHFEELEARCNMSLGAEGDDLDDDPLIALGYNCENLFPALSIVFSRAAISGNPDRHFENGMLLEVVRGARANLGLDPWADPSEDYFEWTVEKHEKDSEKKEVGKEIEDLKQKTAEANRQAAEKASQLRKKERELAALLKKMEEAEKVIPKTAGSPLPKDGLADDRKVAVHELRGRIGGLKSEIRSQQQARRQLREQLREERKKNRVLKRDKKREETPVEREEATPLERATGKILIPEYTDAFRRSCDAMPPHIVAKALRAVAGFAVNDELIWRRTKRIDKVPHLFRIKLDPRRRLMIHSEKDVRIRVLDLIHRENQTTWIKQRMG